MTKAFIDGGVLCREVDVVELEGPSSVKESSRIFVRRATSSLLSVVGPVRALMAEVAADCGRGGSSPLWWRLSNSNGLKGGVSLS